MRHMRLKLAFAIVMVVTLVLTACSSGSGANTSSSSNVGVLDAHKHYTVDFWEVFGTGANKTALQNLTTQYMQQHKNVTVNLVPTDSYATLQTKVNAAIAAHNPPAIAQMYESAAVQYQQAGQIVSLQPYISGSNGLSSSDLADFYPSMLNDGKINGVQYELPFNKSDEVIYYNADVLKQLGLQPPTTLADFQADLTKVTVPGSRWGLSLTPSVDEWSILYKALGGKNFVSKDGKTAAFDQGSDKDYATSALGLLAPLVKAGAVHVTNGYAWQNDFASQKSVFAISTIASYPFLVSAANGAFKFNEAPIPGGPGGQYTVLYGSNIALFKGVSEDTRTAAWDYMKFLVSKQADTSFVKQTGYMPIRQSAFKSTDLQDYYNTIPAREVGPSMIKNAFVASILPGWENCRDDISNAFIGVLKGQITPDAGLSTMSQQCTGHLSD